MNTLFYCIVYYVECEFIIYMKKFRWNVYFRIETNLIEYVDILLLFSFDTLLFGVLFIFLHLHHRLCAFRECMCVYG